MTTHSPAYYRDLLRKISLLESIEFIPQWFRTAWQNNRVKIDTRHEFLRFECEIPVKHSVCSHVGVVFLIDIAGNVFCKNWFPVAAWSGIYFVFPINKTVPKFLKSWRKAQSKLAALASQTLETHITQVSWDLDNIEDEGNQQTLITQVNNSACIAIEKQLQPVSKMLYQLGLQEIER